MYIRKRSLVIFVMVAMSKEMKLAMIFGAIGVASGIGITLAIVDNQTEGRVFQRAVDESGDNSWLNPSFLKSYNEDVRTGAHYRTRLAVGEEGFFVSSAKGGKEPYTYEWKFSDGVTMNAANFTRSFDTVGTYYFDLIVTDADGKQGTITAMHVDVLQKIPEEPANQGH